MSRGTRADARIRIYEFLFVILSLASERLLPVGERGFLRLALGLELPALLVRLSL